MVQSAARLVERRVANRTRDPDLEGKRSHLQFVRRMLTATGKKANARSMTMICNWERGEELKRQIIDIQTKTTCLGI